MGLWGVLRTGDATDALLLLLVSACVVGAVVAPCCREREAPRFLPLRHVLPLLAVLAGIVVFWFAEPGQSLNWAMVGPPGIAAVIWAAALWWRNRWLEQRIDHLSQQHRLYDTVTGLPNHRALRESLQEHLEAARAHGSSVAVLCVDIERFSLFNQTYGHAQGDEVLRWVGNMLKRLLPPKAVVGRYGGDEFLIILPDSNREQAEDIAYHLRGYLSEYAIAYPVDGRRIPINMAVGVAVYPDDASEVSHLLTVCERNLQWTERAVGTPLCLLEGEEDIFPEHPFAALQAMVVAIDKKDRYTLRHSLEVQRYAAWLAEELDLPEPQRRLLQQAALVHDVGKIAIPDEVLMKPGALTAEEYETMKQHSLLGAVILSALPGMEEIVPIVRSHHERWDGKGYPDGLSGEQIPFLARVLTVADAFSAMTADRPYRKGMSWQEAIVELRRQSGKQFDPVLTEVFIRAVNRRIGEASERSHSLAA